ncbi:MAG: GDP-mannose 4,6-dehydratase [Elusimicrobia bacterium]|nr:GDP-mannose 4,6-dehydratase [Elusimicrobiota bacterium]
MNSQPQKTYLITGGAGFIGSHLTELLLDRGFKVLALDNLVMGRLDNIKHFQGHSHYEFIEGDVLDANALEPLARRSQVIVHLAAALGVRQVTERPVYTIETNVGGTQAVLEAAKRYGCRVLVASTSEVYGKGSKIPFSEDDDVVLGATSKSRWGYAASKMVDEFLALGYHREFGVEAMAVRFFNTIGPRQSARYGMVVPRFIRQALAGEPITVYGDGRQSRCFCDARDVVEAVAGLGEHPQAPGRVYNIGGVEEIAVADLAQRIKDLTGSASIIVMVPYSEAYPPGFEDMRRRVPDTARTRSLLGWSPKRGLEDILRDVIAYERGLAALSATRK